MSNTARTPSLGTGLLAPGRVDRWSRLDPRWWRYPAWLAMTIATVVVAHGTVPRILAGVLMGAGSVALQFVSHERVDVRRGALVIATACGLAACFASHSGLAEVVVLVAASRAADSLEDTALLWYELATGVAFGVTVAFVASSLFGLFAGFAVPALVLRYAEHRALVRERDRATALLVEAEAGREAEAQAAALRERGRIAREMHDVLAHSLAGLSVQLQAVRAVAARDGVGRDVLDPLDTAAALARDGLAEARAAVGALRDPVGLGLDALPVLVARHPGAVTLGTSGTAGEVSPEAGHAVYRAVQESLTNAVRYAPGAAVTVDLTWTDTALHVAVADTGRAKDRDPAFGPSTGLGLAGMSERVAAVGGTVEAGPHGSGWRVLVTVPRMMT